MISRFIDRQRDVFSINHILFLGQQMNGTLVSLEDSDVLSLPPLDDLDMLSGSSQMSEVEQVKAKYSGVMSSCVEKLKHMEQRSMPSFLERVNEMVRKAWTVPSHGHILGNSLCNVLRNNGGLDILMDNCVSGDEALQLSSARLLEQCLTHENRGYVVERGLEKVLELSSFTFAIFVAHVLCCSGCFPGLRLHGTKHQCGPVTCGHGHFETSFPAQ